MKYRQYLFLLFSALFFYSGQAQAEVFKCVNIQGAVFYNDKPCPKKDKEIKIKIAKAPKVIVSNLLVQQENDAEFGYAKKLRKKSRIRRKNKNIRKNNREKTKLKKTQ